MKLTDQEKQYLKDLARPDDPPVVEVPKFYEITVVMTKTEYETLRKEGILTADGDVGSAIRNRLGLPEVAYGWRKERARRARR